MGVEVVAHEDREEGRDRFAPSSPHEDRASRSMAYRDRPRASSEPRPRVDGRGGRRGGARATRSHASSERSVASDKNPRDASWE